MFTVEQIELPFHNFFSIRVCLHLTLFVYISLCLFYQTPCRTAQKPSEIPVRYKQKCVCGLRIVPLEWVDAVKFFSFNFCWRFKHLFFGTLTFTLIFNWRWLLRDYTTEMMHANKKHFEFDILEAPFNH